MIYQSQWHRDGLSIRMARTEKTCSLCRKKIRVGRRYWVKVENLDGHKDRMLEVISYQHTNCLRPND